MQNEFIDSATLLQNIAPQIPAQFVLLEFLGEGGHGVVLKAKDTLLDKIVALKLIRTDKSDDEERQVRRMQNEARVLAKLEHPNIVRVFQLGQCLDETPFLVCECLEGETLASYLSKNPQPGPKVITELFSQILDALDCAHTHGLLHRDVKPGNIMILFDKANQTIDLKLLDFGIAKPFNLEDGAVMGLTRTIQLSGSAPYMSPEQCRGEKIDVRSDLYSVACMLWECLFGAPPFVGDTPVLTRYMQIHEPVELPKALANKSSKAQQAVLNIALKGLEKDPSARPESAAAFKEDLLKALGSVRTSNEWSSSKGRSWLLLIALCVILAIPVFLNFAAPKPEKPKVRKVQAIFERSTTGDKDQQGRRLGSKPARMFKLIERYHQYQPDGSDDSILKGVLLVNDLERFEKTIKDTDVDAKSMHFTCKLMKAFTLERANLNVRAIGAWQDVLKLCKSSDGRLTTEALLCYGELSRLYAAEHKYSEAELAAKAGLSSRLLDADVVTSLDIAPQYDLRGNPSLAACYDNLAVVYGVQNRLKEQLDCLLRAEKERQKDERTESTQFTIVKIASVMDKLGDRKRAIQVLKERQAYLRKNYHEDATAEFANSMIEIGRWYEDARLDLDAEDAYKTALNWSVRMPYTQKNDKYVEGLQRVAREFLEKRSKRN